MSETKPDSRQIKKRSALPRLGTAANATVETILDNANIEINAPLRLYAAATPDSKLYFEPSFVSAADGSNKAPSPIKSQIYDIPASSVDFQTQTTTGATFIITFPASTVGFFRRVGFSLLGDGSIQALFSDEAATINALPNAGTVFVKSGIPLGYLELECTDISGLFKTAGSVTDVIESSGVFRLAQGSGGSGTGDANSFTENLKHRLTSSYYEFVTPNVFEIDEDNLIESATASFDVVDGVYKFLSAGQNIVSAQMFDQEFLANDDDSLRVELHAEWFDSASIDSAAVYEVSLDGTNYETLVMTRQGLTTKYTGDKLLSVPSNVALATQALSDTNTELNATTLSSIAATVVLTEKKAVRQLVVELDKLGSPTGSYIVSICENNSGVPGAVLYSTIGLISSLSSGTNIITLSNFRNILPVGTYYIVIETDATYKSSFSAGVNSLRVKTQSGGDDLVFDGSTWSVGSVDVKYTLSGHGYDLRVKITSSAGDKKLKAYGIFYDEHVGDIVEGVQALQKFSFSGNLNTTSFTITRFLPNPEHMKVYDIRTGQVYRYPAFNIDGKTVTFPANTFLAPGETIELIFDQSEGTGFDHSDENSNLLAANHLGSTDATLDKSSNGRGILIRNAAGELKELWLDASNNLNITDPL